MVRRVLSPASVRGRLVAAFGVMVLLTTAVGGVGWFGFGETERALVSLQKEGLGDIALALRLSERSSGLAARAPFIAAITSTPALDEERSRLEDRLVDLTALLRQLPDRLPDLDLDRPHVPTRVPPLVRLAGRLDGTLRSLVDATGEAIDARIEVMEIRNGLERQRALGNALAEAAFRHQPDAPVFRTLRLADGLRDSVAAMLAADNQGELARRREGFEADVERLRRVAASDGTALPELPELLTLLERQSRAADASRRLMGIEQRMHFLVAAANTLAVQMTQDVDRVTAAMQAATRQRVDATSRALDSGKASILALGALCALAALGAALYVVRDVAANLRAVTRAMSALAGGDRQVSVPATDRHDEIGDLARAFNVFKTNVFERDDLARQLGENSRMLTAIFNNMNDGLSVFDQNGQLVAWNPRFLDLNGFTPQDVAGCSLADLQRNLLARGVTIRMIDGRHVDPAALTRLRAAQVVRCEHHFPDDRVVELHSSPMPSGGFITTYSDLTERREIERRLRQAQKMEAVGQLTGGIAHDFNNLLAPIIGNLQMIHDAPGNPEEVRPRALRALDAAERGATTIQRLLAFSRQQALQPQTIDVNEMVEGMLDLLSYGLGSGVTLVPALTPGLPPALVDPGQLENALLNLVVNARDAMGEGGGTITVATRAERSNDAAGASGVVLSVIDTGGGMPPAVLSRVFEPFFTTKRFGRGSGLGLSMVYGFVRQSGGTVDITSEVGQGTTVAMRFPVAPPSEITTPLADRASAPLGPERSVLVVEDDPAVRATAVDLLTGLGYRALAVASADSALALLAREPVDALFTDVMLNGGMNGPELAAAATARHPGLHVLFCSGYARDFLVKSASLPPDLRFIPKPYQKQALAAQLRGLFDPAA